MEPVFDGILLLNSIDRLKENLTTANFSEKLHCTEIECCSLESHSGQ